MLETKEFLLKYWWVVLAAIAGSCPIGLMIIAALKKHFVTWTAFDRRKDEIDKVLGVQDQKIGTQYERIAVLEKDTNSMKILMDKLPKREDVCRIEESISDLRVEVGKTQAGVESVKDHMERKEDQLSLLVSHLLGKARD